jgi:uncharacterized protein (TIGR02646 family)
MKKTIKAVEPETIRLWKAQANEHWQPSYPTLQNPQKRELHLSLLREQGYLCCYCGRRISQEDSHIEHFKPQELFEDLDLSYDNLHASCIRETKPGTPLHCGHHKGNWFDEALHISPLSDGCEERFRYLLSGEIQANQETDFSARKMIEILALDISYLKNRREESITRMFDDSFIDTVSDEELLLLIATLRSLPPEEQNPFDHVVARFAEQLLPRD